MNPLPVIPFTTEETTGCTTETTKGVNEARKNPPSYFFYNFNNIIHTFIQNEQSESFSCSSSSFFTYSLFKFIYCI